MQFTDHQNSYNPTWKGNNSDLYVKRAPSAVPLDDEMFAVGVMTVQYLM